MAEDARLDNKRIMKNSMMLYVRTLFTLVIGLYTSRVVLEVLGIDDFGVYSIVGSLVVMFGFFTNSIASSFSRFLSFELGVSDSARLRSTFNAGMAIVLGLVAVIFVLAETVGLWAFGRLNLPDGSHTAAMWVYQFSVMTAVLSLLQTSFISTIIAHERMGAFAYVDIINYTLKLAAIFVLKFVDGNKLELYGLLVMLVMLSVLTGTAIYCRRNFAECRLSFKVEKKFVKPMLSFSGWSLFKTGCDTLRPAGINVLINLFFGVALNAAVAVALNVSSNMFKFVANVFMAFKPQIIKAYSVRAFDNMQSLMINAFRFSTAAQVLISVPLIIEMPYILKIWLGIYPEYAVVFCRLLVVSLLFDVLISIVEYGVNATGRLKHFSLVTGVMTLSPLVISYVGFKLGAAPSLAYVSQAACCMLCLALDLGILKRLVPELQVLVMVKSSGLILGIGVVTAVVSYLVGLPFAGSDFVRFVVVGATSTILGSAAIWKFVLPASAKQAILQKIRRRAV